MAVLHTKTTARVVAQIYAGYARSTFVLPQARDISNPRHIHTSPPKEQDALLKASHTASVSPAASPGEAAKAGRAASPALSCLPLSQVARTYLITSVSSSPWLLGASTTVLRAMLNSKNPLLSIEKNPMLRAILWETFYKQFCCGETTAQVQTACEDLRRQGYGGVILEYALEVLKDAEGDEMADVAKWRQGLLDTVHMAAEGDFVGLKWSGMGSAAMRLMTKNEQPSKRMDEAMHAVCEAAAARNISLLPAAEETWSLQGFNDWTTRLQRVYNLRGKSVVYTTYQAYLKQTPDTLSRHLATAKQDNFALGVKLVRGAYLSSEDRSLIHPSIEATHHAYDTITSALIHRKYNDLIQPITGSTTASWPSINVVLATHNAVSVQKAQTLRQQQASRGEPLTPLAFAQLQGMADEVSCSLIAAAKASEGDETAVKERVYKCTTWGPMYECLNYLLRRAAENKDAAGRTAETRRAMRSELGRRFRGLFMLG